MASLKEKKLDPEFTEVADNVVSHVYLKKSHQILDCKAQWSSLVGKYVDVGVIRLDLAAEGMDEP